MHLHAGHGQQVQKRISGPILDRIDIHFDMQRVPVQKLSTLDGGEASALIRQRVEQVRYPASVF